jgi:hypothetical protein
MQNTRQSLNLPVSLQRSLLQIEERLLVVLFVPHGALEFVLLLFTVTLIVMRCTCEWYEFVKSGTFSLSLSLSLFNQQIMEHQADEAYYIGPAPAIESYLRGDVIIATAKRAKAEVSIDKKLCVHVHVHVPVLWEMCLCLCLCVFVFVFVCDDVECSIGHSSGLRIPLGKCKFCSRRI